MRRKFILDQFGPNPPTVLPMVDLARTGPKLIFFAFSLMFQEVADQCGDKLGVDKARRFSTLSGYKRLLECGVEAVALETPPYFFPEHAKAAVDEIGRA